MYGGIKMTGFFGQLTAILFSIAVIRYLFRIIFKKYISKLPIEKKYIKERFASIMKLFKNIHKPAGILAAITSIIHFILALQQGRFIIMGFISMILLIMLGVIGIIGTKFPKYKNIFKLHKFVALALVITIIVHIATV